MKTTQLLKIGISVLVIGITGTTAYLLWKRYGKKGKWDEFWEKSNLWCNSPRRRKIRIWGKR